MTHHFQINRPSCGVPGASLILKTMFCRLVAWDLGQWIPRTFRPGGTAFESITTFLICLKKRLVGGKPSTPPAWYWLPSMTPRPASFGVARSIEGFGNFLWFVCSNSRWWMSLSHRGRRVYTQPQGWWWWIHIFWSATITGYRYWLPSEWHLYHQSRHLWHQINLCR